MLLSFIFMSVILSFISEGTQKLDN